METIYKHGLTIRFKQDVCAEDPRKAHDNLGEMVCFHRRYRLGDKHTYSLEDAEAIAESKNYISLPIYLYDHSGITIKTSPFDCPWDSSQVGWIFLDKAKARKEYGKLTKKTLEKIYADLEQEVSTYNAYLTREVYGYIIEDDGKYINSSYGFYCGTKEDREALRQEAENAARYHAELRLSEEKNHE